MDKIANPLARGFNAVTLLQFAAPSILMMIFMGLYTVVDTIFVAQFVNTNALAAINIVCPIINLTVGMAGFKICLRHRVSLYSA